MDYDGGRVKETDEIDWSNPLTNTLRWWFPMNQRGGATAYDIGPYKRHATINLAVPQFASDPGSDGYAFNSQAGTDYPATFPRQLDDCHTGGEGTWCLWFRGAWSSGDGLMGSWSGTPDASRAPIIYLNTTTNLLQFWRTDQDGTSKTASVGAQSVLWGTGLSFVCVRTTSTSTIQIDAGAVGGSKLFTGTASADTAQVWVVSALGNAMTIGSYRPEEAGHQWAGKEQDVIGFKRTLADAEVYSLWRDGPRQMIVPERKVYFVPAAAAAASMVFRPPALRQPLIRM